jgi:hemolysin III
MNGWLSPLTYLLLGWMVAIAWNPLSAWLPQPALRWLVNGGILYSIGSIFYALDCRIPRTRWFGMHEVFHLFVLAGSACHVWLVLRYIILVQG